jgi:hypothetical protein
MSGRPTFDMSYSIVKFGIRRGVTRQLHQRYRIHDVRQKYFYLFLFGGFDKNYCARSKRCCLPGDIFFCFCG